MGKLKLSFHPRELLFSFLIFSLPLSLSLEMNYGLTVVGYADEALCIICCAYLAYSMFRRGIRGADLALIVLLIILTALGFLGNYFSRVITDWFPIAVDAICLLKIFVPFIIFKQAAAADKEMRIARYLVFWAKLVLIAGFICGTITQFADIGMNIAGTDRRYGLMPFYFVFNNEGRYSYICACALLIIMLVEKARDKIVFYELLTIVNIVYTTKGVGYIVAACYIMLLLLWRRDTRITPSKALVLAAGGVVASYTQISIYLLDYESPRMALIRYGIKTANTFFPLGSGFATYGSDMAARYYSQLYVMYGFENRWGLSPDAPQALNDCYLGMAFGQFGYIGTALFAAILIMAFISMRDMALNKHIKALVYAVFIGLVISSLGTAIIKSSIGVFVFAVLGMACGYSGNEKVFTDEDFSSGRYSRLRLKIRS